MTAPGGNWVTVDTPLTRGGERRVPTMAVYVAYALGWLAPGPRLRPVALGQRRSLDPTLWRYRTAVIGLWAWKSSFRFDAEQVHIKMATAGTSQAGVDQSNARSIKI